MDVNAILFFLVGAAVTFLVTNGLKSLSALLGKDLSGLSAGLAAALTGAVVFFANGLLAMVPAQYQPIVAQVFGLVAVVLSAYGIHYSIKSIKTQ